jgi:hypothetical protein
MATDTQMLREHVMGDSYRKIGEARGKSDECARRVVLEQDTELIGELTRHLLYSEIREHWHLNPGWPFIQIPYGQSPREWADALLMLDWTIGKLKRRGFDLVVESHHNSDGLMFVLTTLVQ